MTEHIHNNTTDDAINTLLQNGLFEGIPIIAEMLANAAMILERGQHLKVGAYEHGEARNGQANGFKPRGLQTSFGKLSLNVPQVRHSSGPFHSSLFEQRSRTDRSLKVAIAEMYLQGASTRRVTTVMEKLCGMEVTSCQVSRLTSELDIQFELWRNRPLTTVANWSARACRSGPNMAEPTGMIRCQRWTLGNRHALRRSGIGLIAEIEHSRWNAE